MFGYTEVDLQAHYTPPTSGLDSPTTQYAYSLDQNLTRITRPDGQVVNFSYNAGGRLATLSTPAGSTTYDYETTSGLLSTIAAQGIIIRYKYDGALPLSETWSGAIEGTVSRTYDSNISVSGLSVNEANIPFSYDSDGLLVTAGALTLMRDGLNGRLTATSLGATATSLSYDTFGELSQLSSAHAGIALLDIQYTRDKAGRVSTLTEVVLGQAARSAYSYDQAGRLAGVVKNGVSSTYSYDANGNRVGYNSITASYDVQDRMLTYGSNSYNYTANGEVKTKTRNSETTTYTHDMMGNLTKVVLPTGEMIDYVLDGAHRRVGKKVNGIMIQGFLYDGALRVVAELDRNNAVISRFVYATHANVPEYLMKYGVTYRIITDQLGSPRLVVNTTSGEIAQVMDYDPFGNVTADSNPGFQPFGFAGGLYDRDTKLFHFGARDYDPETGRWTVKDPVGFKAGVNLYQYVDADPVNLTDPSGLDAYMCRKPLDALGGKKAARTDQRSGPDEPYNPLFHKFICVDTGGIPKCGGLTEKTGWLWGPGEPSKDVFFPDRCEKVSDNNSCMDYCLLGKLEMTWRPHYNIFLVGGEHCQVFADDTLSQCRRACAGKP
jgi:RHS repeat-associated protein